MPGQELSYTIQAGRLAESLMDAARCAVWLDGPVLLEAGKVAAKTNGDCLWCFLYDFHNVPQEAVCFCKLCSNFDLFCLNNIHSA